MAEIKPARGGTFHLQVQLAHVHAELHILIG